MDICGCPVTGACRMYAKRLYKRCREGGKTIPGRHGACAPPSMSRGLVPRFSPSSGGRRTKAFVYATSGTKPGASDKGASAAPRQQGVSCGQPPLPLREFAPCRARRRIPRDALLIAGDGLKNKKAGGYVAARHEKRRRGYPHPGREQEPSAAYPGAGFRPNIRDQKKAKQRSPVEERPPDLTVTGRCFANMDHACRAQHGKGRQNLRRRGDTGEGLTSLSSFREFQSVKRGRTCQGAAPFGYSSHSKAMKAASFRRLAFDILRRIFRMALGLLLISCRPKSIHMSARLGLPFHPRGKRGLHPTRAAIDSSQSSKIDRTAARGGEPSPKLAPAVAGRGRCHYTMSASR